MPHQLAEIIFHMQTILVLIDIYYNELNPINRLKIINLCLRLQEYIDQIKNTVYY